MLALEDVLPTMRASLDPIVISREFQPWYRSPLRSSTEMTKVRSLHILVYFWPKGWFLSIKEIVQEPSYLDTISPTRKKRSTKAISRSVEYQDKFETQRRQKSYLVHMHVQKVTQCHVTLLDVPSLSSRSRLPRKVSFKGGSPPRQNPNLTFFLAFRQISRTRFL